MVFSHSNLIILIANDKIIIVRWVYFCYYELSWIVRKQREKGMICGDSDFLQMHFKNGYPSLFFFIIIFNRFKDSPVL